MARAPSFEKVAEGFAGSRGTEEGGIHLQDSPGRRPLAWLLEGPLPRSRCCA